MLKIVNRVIIPSISTCFKGLRFNFMQYFMLVIVYPLSYLIINLVSSNNNMLIISITGIVLSMLISLFINLQAGLVVSSNNASVIEMYAVYQAEPIWVFVGQCIMHYILACPFIVIAIVIFALTVQEINVMHIIIWNFMAFGFLTTLSIYLGGLIKNPNLANPIINMLYMIMIMITPLYNDISAVNNELRLLYVFNPFSHIVSLWYWCFDLPTLVNPILSISIILILCIILSFIDYKRWNKAKANENLLIFH